MASETHDFEDGTTDSFDAVVVAGTHNALTVEGFDEGAPFRGAQGVKIYLDAASDTTALYLEDTTTLTGGERDTWTAIAWRGDAGFTMAVSELVRIGFANEAGAWRWRLFLETDGAGLYRLRGQYAAGDDLVTAYGGFDPFRPHDIHVGWSGESSGSAGDGSMELWVDGVKEDETTGSADFPNKIDTVRVGAEALTGSAADGLLFLDEVRVTAGTQPAVLLAKNNPRRRTGLLVARSVGHQAAAVVSTV